MCHLLKVKSFTQFFQLCLFYSINTLFIFLNMLNLLQYFFPGFKMASTYTQEYFFQHILMNVSFRNLNEIIYPNAENIPEHIPHYASAIFVNRSFWNDCSKVLDDIKLEGHHNDYIQFYMNFLNMQRQTYNLVTKDKFLKY